MSKSEGYIFTCRLNIYERTNFFEIKPKKHIFSFQFAMADRYKYINTCEAILLEVTKLAIPKRFIKFKKSPMHSTL